MDNTAAFTPWLRFLLTVRAKIWARCWKAEYALLRVITEPTPNGGIRYLRVGERSRRTILLMRMLVMIHRWVRLSFDPLVKRSLARQDWTNPALNPCSPEGLQRYIAARRVLPHVKHANDSPKGTGVYHSIAGV